MLRRASDFACLTRRMGGAPSAAALSGDRPGSIRRRRSRSQERAAGVPYLPRRHPCNVGPPHNSVVRPGSSRCMIRNNRMVGTDQQPKRAWSTTLAHTITRPVIVVVMGVSGSGKSTVAALLGTSLGCQFQEGDDLHPPENVEKMRSGTPLSDADRLPGLRKIAEEIDGWRARGECGVLTCSALKRSYRDTIIGGRHDVVLVYLKGSHDLLHQRMAARHEHFMPVALLDSQFATLEEPTPDERPIIVDVGGKPGELANEIVRQLK